jgi:alkylated DNA repair dioxygenase AlkB
MLKEIPAMSSESNNLEDTPPLERHPLGPDHHLLVGRLPAWLLPSSDQFDSLWHMHPADYTKILIHGKHVLTPRWQQAYGRDYLYSGQTNAALPVPAILVPYLTWVQAIHPKLNGLLLNWYDGKLGHYIGKHRDSTKNLDPDAPIVTISLGETRTFRVRPFQGKGTIDFPVPSGCVIVMPFATNQSWMHEIVKTTKATGRRISITARAFQP